MPMRIYFFILRSVSARYAWLVSSVDPVHARLKFGVFWSVLNVGMTQPLAMLTSIVVARILEVSAFGELSMIRSTILMLGVFAGTGLGIAATRHIAEFREKTPERAGRVVAMLLMVGSIMGLLASMLCFVFAETLVVSVMHSETLVLPFKIGSLLLVLNTLNGVNVGVLAGLEAYRAIAILGLLEGVLNLCFVTGGAWLAGVPGAVAGMIIAMVVTLFSKLVAVKQACNRFGIRLKLQGSWAEMPMLRQVALPSVIIAISVQPFEWLGRLMLSHQTNGFSEVGVFGVVQSWGQVMLVLPAQVTVPSLAILTSLYASGEYPSFRRLVSTNLKLVVGLSVLVSLPMLLFTKQIMGLYGTSFMIGVPALRVMVVTYLIAVITMVFSEVLVASNRVWIQSAQKFLWGITMVVSAYFFVDHGAVGLAFAYAVGNFFFLVAQVATMLSLARSMNIDEKCKL